MNNGEKQKKDPLQTEGAFQRQIDKLANESLPLLGKSWVFIARTRVKTWQGLFMLAFVSGAFVSFVWSVSLEIESLSKASGQATLSMDSPQATSGVINVAQDETFDVELLVDTGGVDAVAVRAMVTYNQADFQLTGWNTSDSIFATGNTCVYQGNPCQIIDDDAANGKISLTLAKPSPGVNSHSGLVATLTFKALRNVTSATNNILYTFSGANNETDSDVIEDNGSGNDLLNGVSGIRALVGAPVCTDYNYSNWGACQSGGTQTRTVVSGIPTGCSGGATPDLEQPCFYGNPTCTNFDYSPWGECQSNDSQTRTVIASYPENCEGEPNPDDLVQSCYGPTSECTSYDYGEWGVCQGNGTQVRTAIGVPSGCSSGAEATISQTCTPPADNTCTNFEYSDWGKCVKGKQTRSITSSSPSGCTGGSPVVEQSCKGRKVKIMDTTVNFSNSEKILTSSKIISFSGSDEDLKNNGKVEIYREGKLKTTMSAKSDGSWLAKVKEKKGGTYEYRVRYADVGSAEIEKSSEYRVKIDSEDPEITDLPLFFMIGRGEKLWWDAKDNDEIDHYRYVFLGKSKSTKSKSFNVPADAPTGIHTFQLTAYDEAGNRTVRRILIRV